MEASSKPKSRFLFCFCACIFFFSWTSCLEWRDENEWCRVCVRVAAEPDQGEGNAAPPRPVPRGSPPPRGVEKLECELPPFPFFRVEQRKRGRRIRRRKEVKTRSL
uniref:Putative secreted protein n=1 Tax=Ixodes ricinus TaxID=34613 RepID=A0A6B0UDJ9_IXORI